MEIFIGVVFIGLVLVFAVLAGIAILRTRNWLCTVGTIVHRTYVGDGETEAYKYTCR